MQTIGKQEKVKRINVYLNYEDKKILNEIRDKYHLSYSTIANIIFEKMCIGKPNILLMLRDHYYFEEDKSTKTSIRPRHASKESYYGQGTWPITMIMTNVIKIFTRNKYKEILGLDQKETQKLNSRIYNEFQNTYDPNWDGNSFTRKMAKFIKQNPEYTRKLMEKGEDR